MKKSLIFTSGLLFAFANTATSFSATGITPAPPNAVSASPFLQEHAESKLLALNALNDISIGSAPAPAQPEEYDPSATIDMSAPTQGISASDVESAPVIPLFWDMPAFDSGPDHAPKRIEKPDTIIEFYF